MNHALLPNLFRSEFGKITAVLARHFSLDRIEVAEDLASETFLLAMETWPYKGVPENPTAWLYAVAKNKARNLLNREKIYEEKVRPELYASGDDVIDIDLSPQNIRDSQLQMLFTLCHPAIPGEAQVGLCLRILCGFGIDEIATAFLTNKETINKRLQRAKQKLREKKIAIELPAQAELLSRINNVLTALYLLFSEGYYSETGENIVREELCEEAIRLTQMLTIHAGTGYAEVHALLALMYFQASRLKTRNSGTGEVILYDDQDPALWNREYISRGAYHLKTASQGKHLSTYHLEAGIAYWHTVKEDTLEKWEAILQLYNKLLQLKYSPPAALNRTYALSKCRSSTEAIREAEKLKLETSPYYFSLLAELYKTTDRTKAIDFLNKAIALSKSRQEKELMERKISALQ